jgi:hypothetical protein
MSMSSSPGPIDRAALDRIIRRAAELQTADRDISDQLTPDDVMTLGQEVGIPRRYLQQAMLEEQSRPPDQATPGILDRLAGPAEVGSYRVVRGDPDGVTRALLRWIEQNELLAVQRQQPGRISWEPLRGISAAIRKSSAALGSGSRPFMLSKAELVTATITPLEADFCHVALRASVRPIRSAYVGGSATALTLGAGAATALVALSAFLPIALLPLPMAVGVGYATLRRYRPVPARVLLGLERVLDSLETGGIKPVHQLPARGSGILEIILGEVRRSLESPTRPRPSGPRRGTNGS